MKKRIEFHIYKRLYEPPKDGKKRGRYFMEQWDGPFTSYSEAMVRWRRIYRNKKGSQDFAIGKTVTTFANPEKGTVLSL